MNSLLRGELAELAAHAPLATARQTFTFTLLGALWFCCTPGIGHAGSLAQDRVRHAVDQAIHPMMAKDQIPGVAVGIIVNGQPAVFDFGVASTRTHRPVTHDTLFELGSVSKTFTATLASWAQENGRLSLGERVGHYLPALNGSAFGNVSLLNLGTHTPGGLPLQVPDEIHDNAQLLRYFNAWRPTYAPGTYRTYSNPGIGTLGMIAANSIGQDFNSLIEQRLFPALGMTDSFIDIPVERAADYAQGYTKDGKPVRMTGGVLASEAYGVKSTASDMLRFIEANMQLLKLDPQWQRAITATHTGYFNAGPMTQDLIWEQYPYPVALKPLLEGNGPAMALDATPVTAIAPPLPPTGNVWINKTGSTNGFGAYVAFVPQRRMGIVILANRNFPIADRVAAAYAILAALDGAAGE
ncbi:class C beta-lactamase [Paraburkholderia solisilvae]